MLNYRNEIIMYLVHDCSLNYKQIYNSEHSEILIYLEGCPELYEAASTNTDILKSNKTGKNITVRTMQDIMANYDRQIKSEMYTTITGITDKDYFCGYIKMEGLTLDEEFELRLKNSDLLSFLRGCGYNNKEMTLNQVRRNIQCAKGTTRSVNK